MMFRSILETQWKWTRGVVLLASVMSFTVPLASLAAASATDTPRDFINVMYMAGVAYAVLASGLGLAVAVIAWGPDHRGRHVYALTLPVPRWRYALMRLMAGGTFLLPAAGALLLGSYVVAFSGMIPDGLQAYPVTLTLRFLIAAGVAFSIFFAIASGTQRTAGIILGVIGTVLVAWYVLGLGNQLADPLFLTERLFGPGGILSVFSGRWMLVDA